MPEALPRARSEAGTRSARPSTAGHGAIVMRNSIFILAMSTPVGHSRLQPLHETQEVEGLLHVRRCEGIGPELAGDGEPQRIGAAAGDVLFLPRRPVGRTHGAGESLAAGPLLLHISTAAPKPPHSDQSSTGFTGSTTW